MQITKAIVPAAGRGTRLYPITRVQPKEMLPLGSRPVVQRVAEELTAAGVTDILFITGADKRTIEDHFDPSTGLAPDDAPAEAREWGPNLSAARFYSIRQGAPRGLGDAVSCGEHFAGQGYFVCALGDCTMTGPEPLSRLVDAHKRHEADLSILVQPVEREATRRYGIIEPGDRLDDSTFEMIDIVEKPGPEAAPSRHAVAARYVFSSDLFDYLNDLEPGHGDEIQLTDAIRNMLADGYRGIAVPLAPGEHRLDVGNLKSYGQAFIREALTDPEYGEGLRTYTANLLAHLDDPQEPDPDLPTDA